MSGKVEPYDKIGLFGGIGSGKTIYLTVLFRELSKGYDSKLAVKVDPYSSSYEYLEEKVKLLYERQELPRPTRPNECERIQFHLMYKRGAKKGERAFSLWTYDFPGESLENCFKPKNYLSLKNPEGIIETSEDSPLEDKDPSGTSQVPSQTSVRELIDEIILEAKGFIFLIDPFRQSKIDQDSLLLRIARAIEAGRSKSALLKTPIVFVVSKADQVFLSNQTIEEYIAELVPLTYSWQSFSCENVGFFSLYSLGKNIDVIKKGDKSIPKVPKNLQPKNIADPLEYFI
ncbi:MAG: hypothetical protein GF364_16750 [Candidatus Lokiarchaeota archaeon]|nr:hypothetical protein [Candidatus Lokiarchaeota archaeon]